jgi:putative PIN family toxin of toxin-antitoxin system
LRAVIDTVVFVRALINPHGRWGRLLFQHCDRYVLVLSPEIIKEILEVLHRSSLRQRFPRIDEVAVDRVLATFERAEVVTPLTSISVCRDPDDDKFFECAVAGEAGYIVSEDNDILVVGTHEGTRTVSAAELLSLIDPGR